MIFKLIGTILIIGSSGAIGYIYSYSLALRLHQLTDIDTTLSRLESEISLALTPLPRAFSLCAAGSARALFEAAAERICALGAAGAFCEAIESRRGEMCLTKDDWAMLYDFASGLGAPDKDGQLKNIALARLRLGHSISDAHLRYTKYGRLYKSSGIMLGLAIAILLL